jgi:hypothetical protein
LRFNRRCGCDPCSNFLAEVKKVANVHVQKALHDVFLLYTLSHVQETLGCWLGFVTVAQVSSASAGSVLVGVDALHRW